MGTSVKMEVMLMGTTGNDQTPKIPITTLHKVIQILIPEKQELVQKIIPPMPITMESVKKFTLDQEEGSTTITIQEEKYMCQNVDIQ